MMTATAIPVAPGTGDYEVQPWWARAHRWYWSKMPNHKGKGRILNTLHGVGLRGGRPFLWKMENGNYVAIEPREGLAAWSVGWTCFLSGKWEPHVERLLNERVRPGSVVMDIGANIGYFSAVMAARVGATGRVWSFEPVPATFRQLSLCRSFNHLDQMSPINVALGDENTSAKIHFNAAMMGSASIHGHMSDEQPLSADIEIRRLDDLWKKGDVTEPDLIKIDVEGHEYAAFYGARELLAKARPQIVFEYNRPAATAAGWDLAKLVALLRECCDYQFFRVTADSWVPLDMETFSVAEDGYVDLLALPPERVKF
jgi:FkbM family methyltransferase